MPANDGIEDAEHVSFRFDSIAVPRRDLIPRVFALLLPFRYTNFQNSVLTQCFLCGDKTFPANLINIYSCLL